MRDMWLTGFDSPSMHTMYVDKPMRGAPLMQAIARVNRTFKDKPAGLVVDYIGIAEDLKSALADYTNATRHNQELGEDLREQAIPAMVEEHEVVDSILAGYRLAGALAAGGDKAYLRAVAGTVELPARHHPGPDRATRAPKKTLPEVPVHGARPATGAPCSRCACPPPRRSRSGRRRLHRGRARLIAKIEGTDREGPAAPPSSTPRSTRSSPRPCPAPVSSTSTPRPGWPSPTCR